MPCDGPSARGKNIAGLAACLLLSLAAGLALPAGANSSRHNASPDVRQLAIPFHTPARRGLMRSSAARRAQPAFTPRHAPIAARFIVSSQLTHSGHGRWRGYRPLSTRQLRAGASSAGFDERRPGDTGREASRRGPRRPSLKRMPPLSREIVVDQLLVVPRADGYGDDRLPSLATAGIPVFRDVPAIVIINPQRPARDRFGTPLRYPAR
jgi:hypothetical protein